MDFRITRNLLAATAAIVFPALAACSRQNVTETVVHDGFTLISQSDGPALGYSPASGVTILYDGDLAFKDLNRNGTIDAYEDWRLAPEVRAEALAKALSIEHIAGLMPVSDQQHLPQRKPKLGTYSGLPYDKADAEPWAIQDHQKYHAEKNLQRNFLVQKIEESEYLVRWNNAMQAMVEGAGFGIPVNIHSDPRYFATAVQDVEFLADGGRLSLWPSHLGFGATFDPATSANLGKYMSEQYRALGITTALSPQIDLGTEPRWKRYDSTYGDSWQIAADMCRGYVLGFQSSPAKEGVYTDNGYLSGLKAAWAARKAGNAKAGWGAKSVATMAKHWPGGGTGEAGRDAHFSVGKYAVYPGGNFEEHMRPFKEGAFDRSNGDIGVTSAIMPYYTISVGVDSVANGFSRYIIHDLLREGCSFDGIVCSDWQITEEYLGLRKIFGKPWGVEHLPLEERYFMALYAGLDQFGGVSDIAPVLAAYNIWTERFGEESARARFEESARRILTNSFRTGLFENPYLDMERSMETLNNAEAREAGLDAQRKSVVMLKNHAGALPRKAMSKVYVPERHYPATPGFFSGNMHYEYERVALPVNLNILGRYFEYTAVAEEADFALVFIENPGGGYGYDRDEPKRGGNGYTPISLQYGPYTAEYAREVSLGGGDPLESFTNRSYKGKSQITWNSDDAELVKRTKEAMGDKPVVVILTVDRPCVVSEWEQSADAILLDFRVERAPLLEAVCGEYEPSGLLPFQMPADMRTVELQHEDVGRDMTPHTDADGNLYDFAFGLGWDGVISDWRTEKYK